MTRSIRPDAVLVQAVIAGALSFAHLHDLAAAAGQDGWKAWAYPISVDLLLVAAWRRLRGNSRSRLAWSWFLIALVASLGANVATAGLLDLEHVPAWLRILVAGWPALAFLGGTLLAHSLTTGDRVPVPPAPAAPAPAPDIEPVPAPEPAREQISTPAPVPALPEAAAPAVPPALVDHAHKLAAEHRTRTGADIDAATLRARGIPEDLATSIVAQLA
ncbi:DUF2637 domain-containing protein [Streptomyces umbrinus]|uniref:DUF2637 domain-containing protein n=1 Tax=Streptomyces umbrinus TaxID=67370 RepID=UPI0033C137E6